MNVKILLTTGLLAATFSVGAQQANRGYAITGNGNKDFMWMNIRQVDLGTGQVTKNIYEVNKTNYVFNDVDNNKKFTVLADQAHAYNPSTFVAAAAYDKRSNKLYFIPMRTGQLRWVDVNAKNDDVVINSVAIPNYVPSTNTEEANNITRMVIAADGVGYAVTNDGSHLYKFTTGKKPVITDLGALVDADENKGLSVHNKCSSWGGDMLADAYGKLYILSATKSVFVIDVNTRMATYKGSITGLPGNYTTNGAAVDADGAVVLCSAIAFDGYYKMNITDLKANKMEGSDMVYNASDLASGNLLFQKEADNARNAAYAKTFVPVTNTVTADNRIFPNPLVGNSFNVLLDGKQNGTYSIVITDLAGRALQTNRFALTKGQQTQQITLRSTPAKGTYLVKLLDEKNVKVLTDKIVVL